MSGQATIWPRPSGIPGAHTSPAHSWVAMLHTCCILVGWSQVQCMLRAQATCTHKVLVAAAGMQMSPEMLQTASNMMANMSPEAMQSMMNMAAGSHAAPAGSQPPAGELPTHPTTVQCQPVCCCVAAVSAARNLQFSLSKPELPHGTHTRTCEVRLHHSCVCYYGSR